MHNKANLSKERILAKNTLMLYIMQISTYVFPLLSFPYLTRVLGADKYGIVVLANSVMAYFTLLIEFGFILSGTNSCSKADGDKSKLGNITFGIIEAKFFLLLLGAIILAFICIFVDKFKTQKLFFILSYIGVGLTIFIPDYLFRGIEQMSIITYRVVLSKAIYTVFIFACIRKDSDYLLIPVATIAANIIAVLLTWIEILRKKIIEVKLVRLHESFEYLKDSSTFFLSRVASSFYTTLNTLLLGLKFPSIALAQYGVANTLTSTCRSMMNPIADSIYPYMVKQKNYRLVKKIVLILEPIICIGCFILWFIAGPVIRIVCGEGYDNAVPILRAMLPLIIITLPTYMFGFPVLGALGKIKWANISVVIGAIFHVVIILLLFFINKLNFISLSILSFFTEVVVCSIRVYITLKTIKRGHN